MKTIEVLKYRIEIYSDFIHGWKHDITEFWIPPQDMHLGICFNFETNDDAPCPVNAFISVNPRIPYAECSHVQMPVSMVGKIVDYTMVQEALCHNLELKEYRRDDELSCKREFQEMNTETVDRMIDSYKASADV
jgi:hypothetical protein